MKPLIPDKSIVILVRKSTFENADLTTVLIYDEHTIKHIQFVGNKVILIPKNNDYDLDCFKTKICREKF